MIICKNEKCANFKQELEDGIDICPACGLETAKIDSDKDGIKKLGPISAVVSILSILLTFFLFGFIPNFYVSFFIGVVLIGGCITVAVISKLKGAIITTILAALAFFGIFAYYGIF